MRIPRGALPVAALTCSILLGACGGGSAPSGAASDPDTTDATAGEILSGLPSDFALPGLDATYESVTLAPDTSVVDKATIKRDLRSVDSRDDGATLRFAGDSDVARSLRPGQVVSFETIGIGRVESVGEDGGEILVTATAAPLSDFISDGVVAWSAPISFDDIPEEAYAQAAASEGFKVASVSDGPPGFAPELAIKGKGLSFKGKIKGFDVAYSFTPTPDQLKFRDHRRAPQRRASWTNEVRITAKGFVASSSTPARRPSSTPPCAACVVRPRSIGRPSRSTTRNSTEPSSAGRCRSQSRSRSRSDPADDAQPEGRPSGRAGVRDDPGQGLVGRQLQDDLRQ